jgi:hypothetical protein
MSRQGANKLLKGLFSRAYSTGRYSARAGEEIAAVSNAHRQELGVIDVSVTYICVLSDVQASFVLAC